MTLWFGESVVKQAELVEVVESRCGVGGALSRDMDGALGTYGICISVVQECFLGQRYKDSARVRVVLVYRDGFQEGQSLESIPSSVLVKPSQAISVSSGIGHST